MSYSIGPLQFDFLTDHRMVSSKNYSDVSVIGKKSSSYVIGYEFESYTLVGAFYNSNANTARLQRKQLNELVNNPNIDFIYINFDQDTDLSGWFLLESLETAIDAAIFENYTFTLNVKKVLGGSFGIYQGWKSNPFIHVYTTAEELWLSYHNDRMRYATAEYRVGYNGLNTIVRGDLSLSPMYYQNLPVASNIYNMRCEIFDTTIQNSTTSSAVDPVETTWQEKFGVYKSFEGDVVFSNGLIRYIWDDVLSGGRVYLWTGNNWQAVTNPISWAFSTSPTNLTSLRKPVITYFSWNKIVWNETYQTDEQRNIHVRYKMLRGSYFINISIKSDHGNILNTSFLTRYPSNTHVSYDENITSSNYISAQSTTTLGTSVKYGLFFTDGTVSNTGTNGVINLGYATLPGVWTHLGLFAIRQPNTGNVSPAILARQFLANMDFGENLLNIQDLV